MLLPQLILATEMETQHGQTGNNLEEWQRYKKINAFTQKTTRQAHNNYVRDIIGLPFLLKIYLEFYLGLWLYVV
jgi:hypothetical protein